MLKKKEEEEEEEEEEDEDAAELDDVKPAVGFDRFTSSNLTVLQLLEARTDLCMTRLEKAMLDDLNVMSRHTR